MAEKYMKLRKKIEDILVWVKYYCVAVLLLMIIISFVQVVRRYAFNIPWAWSDEITLLLLSWFAYPTLLFNTFKDDHFHISAVYDKFGPSVQKILDALRFVLQGVFLILLAYYGAKLTKQYWNKPMAASNWPLGIKFIPVILGAGIAALFSVLNLIGLFINVENEEEVTE